MFAVKNTNGSYYTNTTFAQFTTIEAVTFASFNEAKSLANQLNKATDQNWFVTRFNQPTKLIGATLTNAY